MFGSDGMARADQRGLLEPLLRQRRIQRVVLSGHKSLHCVIEEADEPDDDESIAEVVNEATGNVVNDVPSDMEEEYVPKEYDPDELADFDEMSGYEEDRERDKLLQEVMKSPLGHAKVMSLMELYAGEPDGSPLTDPEAFKAGLSYFLEKIADRKKEGKRSAEKRVAMKESGKVDPLFKAKSEFDEYEEDILSQKVVDTGRFLRAIRRNPWVLDQFRRGKTFADMDEVALENMASMQYQPITNARIKELEDIISSGTLTPESERMAEKLLNDLTDAEKQEERNKEKRRHPNEALFSTFDDGTVKVGKLGPKELEHYKRTRDAKRDSGIPGSEYTLDTRNVPFDVRETGEEPGKASKKDVDFSNEDVLKELADFNNDDKISNKELAEMGEFVKERHHVDPYPGLDWSDEGL